MTAAVTGAGYVEAEAGASGTRLTRLRSVPPLVLRRTGPAAVHLVSVGAGPLGGDDLRLRVRVGEDACLRVTQVAAALALPGPDGRPSRLQIDVDLGRRAELRWEHGPTVAVAGSYHDMLLAVRAAPDASLWWRDEVVCGRTAEPSGIVRSRVTVTLGDAVRLRSDTTVGDAQWESPAVGAGARVLGTLLLLGAAADGAPAAVADRVAVLRPCEGLAVVTALGDAHPDVRATLHAAGGPASPPVVSDPPDPPRRAASARRRAPR